MSYARITPEPQWVRACGRYVRKNSELSLSWQGVPPRLDAQEAVTCLPLDRQCSSGDRPPRPALESASGSSAQSSWGAPDYRNGRPRARAQLSETGSPRPLAPRSDPTAHPGREPCRHAPSGKVQTDGHLIRHARYFILQLGESYLTRSLFGQILGRIERLAWHPI